MIAKKKLWIITLLAIICGLISIFVLDPVYEASTTLIVNKELEDESVRGNTSDDLNFVQKLAVTYGEIIKSRTVITSTINRLNLNSTYEEI